MRSFVAIELNNVCREKIKHAINDLKKIAPDQKWVEPVKTHLTLKFIGDLSDTDLPIVIQSLHDTSKMFSPFQITLEGISGFPPAPTAQPKVIHIPVHESSGTLKGLAGEIDNTLLNQLGIKKEERQFIPHVTIGRRRKKTSCPQNKELQDAVEEHSFGTICVDDFVLMRSKLTSDGPFYSVVEKFDLIQQAFL